MPPIKSGIKLVTIVAMSISIVGTLIAFPLYRVFKPEKKSELNAQKFSKRQVICNYLLYFLLFMMMFCVYDGQLYIASASHIWQLYDPSYSNAVGDWTIAFSLFNMLSTLFFGFLIDILSNKCECNRMNLFGIIWASFAVIPLRAVIIFNTSHSRHAFGVVYSMLGVPFGV